jgi:hypothetical protein
MPNVFFNLKLTWASVTNDIRVSVYNTLDLNTPIASLQQNAPHIDQQFSFPGLPRQNFVYKVLECEINGSTVLQQLGKASFVAANDELQYKKPVLIQVGVDNIPGTNTVWPANVNTVNIPDFIGWEFEASGRPGQYPFKRDEVNQLDINWTSASGDLTLGTLGDVFQDTEYLYFEFQPIISQSSGGVGPGTTGNGFSDILVVTADTTLTTADIGKKILISPAGNYLEITLPDYTSGQANIITYFEMVGGSIKCAKILPHSGQAITWFNNHDLFICPGESFELYKRVVSTGVYQWRAQNLCGNFMNVGEFAYNDNAEGNLTLLDGGNRDYQQYARLLDWISRNSNAIAYATWSSANIFTRMKYSLKETSGNNFRVPDLITNPIYQRPVGAGQNPGDYIPQMLLMHQHMESIGQLPSPPFGQTSGTQHAVIGGYKDTGNWFYDLTSRAVQFNSASGLYIIVDGNENNPNSRASNVYVKI